MPTQPRIRTAEFNQILYDTAILLDDGTYKLADFANHLNEAMWLADKGRYHPVVLQLYHCTMQLEYHYALLAEYWETTDEFRADPEMKLSYDELQVGDTKQDIAQEHLPHIEKLKAKLELVQEPERVSLLFRHHMPALMEAVTTLSHDIRRQAILLAQAGPYKKQVEEALKYGSDFNVTEAGLKACDDEFIKSVLQAQQALDELTRSLLLFWLSIQPE